MGHTTSSDKIKIYDRTPYPSVFWSLKLAHTARLGVFEVMSYISGVLDLTSYSLTEQTLALTRYGQVGPRLFQLLLTQFHTTSEILLAESESLAAIPGLKNGQREQIANAYTHLDEVRTYVRELGERDIGLTSRFEESYPASLFELNDPPPLLFTRSELENSLTRRAAVVGSLQASTQGLELAGVVARKMAAAEVGVVTSLHGGIDSAVQLATHKSGGRSMTVVDSGFDSLVASELWTLAMSVLARGALLSEFPPETPKRTDTYRATNRLIAGLSQAVIVVEMGETETVLHDLLECCEEIGKLAFIVIDPKHGVLSDETSLARAMKHGAIPLEGLEKIDDIIRSLV